MSHGGTWDVTKRPSQRLRSSSEHPGEGILRKVRALVTGMHALVQKAAEGRVKFRDPLHTESDTLAYRRPRSLAMRTSDPNSSVPCERGPQLISKCFAFFAEPRDPPYIVKAFGFLELGAKFIEAAFVCANRPRIDCLTSIAQIMSGASTHFKRIVDPA